MSAELALLDSRTEHTPSRSCRSTLQCISSSLLELVTHEAHQLFDFRFRQRFRHQVGWNEALLNKATVALVPVGLSSTTRNDRALCRPLGQRTVEQKQIISSADGPRAKLEKAKRVSCHASSMCLSRLKTSNSLDQVTPRMQRPNEFWLAAKSRSAHSVLKPSPPRHRTAYASQISWRKQTKLD